MLITTESLLALMAYAAVMSVTPGPNNVLLLNAGVTFGLYRTSWHMAGIAAGVALQIMLAGAGLGLLFTSVPAAQIALKLAGSAYMLWLTLKLWRAGELRAAASVRPIRFIEAAGFQFINPKAWLMATTVIAAFVPAGEHYAERVVFVALVFVTVGLPCIGLWAGFGSALRSWVNNPVALRRINRTMAVLAAATILLFWL